MSFTNNFMAVKAREILMVPVGHIQDGKIHCYVPF